MIKLPFSVAIALYTLAVSIVIFGLWIWGESKRKKRTFLSKKNLWECPICTNIYWSEEKNISQCPQCHSLNKESDKESNSTVLKTR